MAKCTITTKDNPFNPFEDFKRWWMFDELEHHYKTCEKLADMMNKYGYSSDMNEEEADALKEYAIDRMIELDFENIYIKIFE